MSWRGCLYGAVMKKTLEISASFSGKIPTAQYESSSPFFALKEILEDCEYSDENIKARQQELQKMCVDQFNNYAEILYQQKVAKAYQNIRFYDAGNGQKYPSVTSIINMDENFFMPADELIQYGARGTVIHKQIEIFLKTGEWKAPKDIPEIAFEVMTVLKGTLNLSLEDVNFTNFYKDYPFCVLAQEKQVINHANKFAGRLDILCVIESTNKGKWDKIEGVQFDVPTVLDIKTSAQLDKVKGFTQQAAYAKSHEGIAQIGLIHLTKENICGYAKPQLTSKIDHYWTIFINQRMKFKERYGV